MPSAGRVTLREAEKPPVDGRAAGVWRNQEMVNFVVQRRHAERAWHAVALQKAMPQAFDTAWLTWPLSKERSRSGVLCIPLWHCAATPRPSQISAGVLGWRWAVEVWPFGVVVGTQILSPRGWWGPTHHRYVGVSIHLRLSFGFAETYYDVPQRALWLGFICISWSRNL